MIKIAFLGLGLMGQGMAKNLMESGYELTVWNRSPDKTKAFVDAGATTAKSPAEAVEGADVIITIVGDDLASQHVWLGEGGILSGNLKSGAIAIECTTVSRQWMEILGKNCIDVGLRFLDCPVTGGPEGAENGQLNLLMGGAEETIAGAEPVLKAFSKRIFRFGDIGTGTAYKLIVNSLGAAHVVALAEAMLVAHKAGLNLDTVAEALCNGSVSSRVTNSNAPKMAGDAHDDVAFAAKWRAKDVSYGADMAHSLGCEVPIFHHAANVFKDTVEIGLGEVNESDVLSVLKQAHATS